MKRSVGGLFLVLSVLSAAGAAKTQVTLLLSHESARPGDTVMAGVRLRTSAGWHTYWRNSGDSGAATTIRWHLPEGVTAGPIEWPIPVTHTTGDLVTYGYDDDVVLLVPLRLGSNVLTGAAKFSAKISWLECDVATCVPGKADVEATLLIGETVKASANAAIIESWQKRLPQKDAGLNFTATWNREAAGDQRELVLEWVAPNGVAEANFHPYEAEAYAVRPVAEMTSPRGGKIRQVRVVEKLEGNWPAELTGLVVQRAGSASSGYVVKAAIKATPLAAAVERGAGANLGVEAVADGSGRALSAPAAGFGEAGQGGSTPPKSLAFYLGLAFLGGLILNIMPCVLPVIALKILGFVNQSREEPGRVRMLGLVYGAGVLFSFLVLAGLVIGVMQAGHRASWGMQFGNPQFIVVLTVLVTLVALNLFGLYEVTLGGAAMDTAGQLAAKEGVAGAFFNGVLATALATPCTAPFLGAALGFAFTQPPTVIALVFLTVGLGLALPYVILSWHPAWLKFVPKPGAWMERFKIAMGFPMLATAIWLFQLAANHYGKRTLWLGLFLVIVALVAWMFGEFVQRGRARRGMAGLIALALLICGFLYAVEGQLRWRDPIKETGGPLQESPDGIPWQKWSPEAVAEARSKGRPVFVDFTADWCVTCQANKKTSIEISSVRQKLKEIDAVPLLADYTNTPDDITEELAKFGRAGVPLVLVYPRDASKPPIVLPEFLRPGIVLKALEEAAK